MKYLKLFEYYNDYYFPVNQEEFDYYLQRDELFCFTDDEMKKVANFLKNYKIEDHYFLSATLYFMNELNDRKYFWIHDKYGLDKTLNYDQIIVHSYDKKTHKISKSLTKYSELPNKICRDDGEEVDREYTLINFSLNIRPIDPHDPTIWISKSFDEWYLFADSNEVEMYKCDRLDGLFKLLSEKLNKYKR